MSRALFVLFLFSALPSCSIASSLSVGGFITQSTADGTGPAMSNPSLNNLTDFESYTLTLDVSTAVTGPGTYDLTALSFDAPGAPASESDFETSTLTVTADGGSYDFSLFACIAGADCFAGNSLSASFSIPAGSFNGLSKPATGLDEPHPFDLLEDDGVTDIQGSITTYSNAASAVTPEPSSGSFLALACIAGGVTLSLTKGTAATRRFL